MNQNKHLLGELTVGSTKYRMILYPYITGKDGYQEKLSDHHWVELGSTFKKVHAAKIPADLISNLPSETYNPSWRESVKGFQARVEIETFSDPVAKKVSTFMRAKQQEISRMVVRAEELSSTLSHHPPGFVLCHADAHPGNFLISDQGKLYLVDWDAPILAPKERDLMFFGAGMAGVQPGGREETLFYQGYGPADVDRRALAYYRIERIIQDIAQFCKQLLLTSNGGDDREQAYTYLTSSFLPDSEYDAAIRTDQQSNN
jgi:spectinomycin phosphotransferase